MGFLVAEVTQSSVERLQLEVGRRVVASFKAAGTRLIPA
jgi:molybdopterin-binding protein